jgi:hypothetical protein
MSTGLALWLKRQLGLIVVPLALRLQSDARAAGPAHWSQRSLQR